MAYVRPTFASVCEKTIWLSPITYSNSLWGHYICLVTIVMLLDSFRNKNFFRLNALTRSARDNGKYRFFIEWLRGQTNLDLNDFWFVGFLTHFTRDMWKETRKRNYIPLCKIALYVTGFGNKLNYATLSYKLNVWEDILIDKKNF